jgi:hypothetical protein
MTNQPLLCCAIHQIFVTDFWSQRVIQLLLPARGLLPIRSHTLCSKGYR